ncbi:hypothetical protein DB88DRAFT_507006 [Papiliotrema laurentii]|uniref:Uncharacterized protein n=1 Tax=Papiliotrema laurentii TaxID=5418 RepID=A0AAD9FVL4_PAPLA|nr:hypothetical protein DB88DRAFT_507006 [Papiliotrema laurentii]
MTRLTKTLGEMRDPRQLTGAEWEGARSAFSEAWTRSFGGGAPSCLSGTSSIAPDENCKEEYTTALWPLTIFGDHIGKEESANGGGYSLKDIGHAKEVMGTYIEHIFGEGSDSTERDGDDCNQGNHCHCQHPSTCTAPSKQSSCSPCAQTTRHGSQVSCCTRDSHRPVDSRPTSLSQWQPFGDPDYHAWYRYWYGNYNYPYHPPSGQTAYSQYDPSSFHPTTHSVPATSCLSHSTYASGYRSSLAPSLAPSLASTRASSLASSPSSVAASGNASYTPGGQKGQPTLEERLETLRRTVQSFAATRQAPQSQYTQYPQYAPQSSVPTYHPCGCGTVGYSGYTHHSPGLVC